MTKSENDPPEWFRTMANAYGGALDRWPRERRDAAAAILLESAAARGILNDAQALDALLAAAPPPAASPDLMAAILLDAPAAPWRWAIGLLWPGAPAWKPAAALCAAALLGIGLGVSNVGAPSADEFVLAVEVDSLMFGDVPIDGDWQ